MTHQDFTPTVVAADRDLCAAGPGIEAPSPPALAASVQPLPDGDGTSSSRARKRGGAPAKNSNATTHGLKGSKFPPGAIREETTVRAIVRAAQAACEAKHGHPATVHQMAILHRLRRAATKDRLAARWLRLEKNLTVEQRLGLADAMEAASTTIEKCLKQLGLEEEAGPADPWAALPPLPAAASSPAEEGRS